MGKRKQPFGYKMKLGEIVPQPREAETVRSIYLQYLAGASFKQLAERLQTEDVPYDEDKSWNKNMVARILEDDRYIGEKEFPALIPTEQFHAAQYAAAVGKADYPVFLVGADGVPAHQPLPGQFIQLRKGRGEPFFPGHLLVFVAAGQGRHSGVCLLHLGGIVGGEGRLCRILHLARSVCRPCGGSQHSRQHQCQCADRAQNSMALFLHVKTVPPRTPGTGHLPPRYVSF